MHPTLISWKGIGLHTWGLMITLAFAAAALLVNRRARRVGIDPDRLVPIYLLAPLFGLVGARLLHFTMAEPELFFHHPLAFFDINQGGFAFYGGVIVASAALLGYLAHAKLPLLKVADLCAPAVLLGDALGRIGCFFAGCCHGRPVGVNSSGMLLQMQGGEIHKIDGFPWIALIYRKGVGVGDIFDVPIYPTQLWESVGAFTLVVFLSWMWARHRRFDGQISGMALILYAILRYTVETFRGDTVRGVGYLGHYSTSQMVSFAMVALGVGLLLWRMGKGLGPETPILEEDEQVTA